MIFEKIIPISDIVKWLWVVQGKTEKEEVHICKIKLWNILKSFVTWESPDVQIFYGA